MENTPGISLFQNSEFNRLEFNLPEPEEIEAAEDEKRRNEELKEMMQNAFDDLEDDSHSVENSYYDSSHGCDRNPHQLSKDRKRISNETPSSIPNHSPRFRSPGYDNYQQLQVLYQVRLREIDKLHNEMEAFKELSSREKAQLTEKIAALETEKEKALLSFGESQKTLVETQRRLSNCEKELRELKEKFIEADSQKNQALHELEMCKLTNRELEQRLVVAERNSFKNEEKNFDNYLKEINSKHKREVADFQKELKLLSNKLMAKENDCLKLEHQLLDLQRLHESVLVEKSEIINKLTANLEESQSQCHKLISNSTNHDIAKLMNQLKSQKAEINSLSIQLSALKKEKNQLIDQIQKLKSENNHSSSAQNKSYTEELQNIEKKLQQLTLENESLKETISKKESFSADEKKEDFLKLIENNITTDMKEKISKLESQLEERLKESDNVKKMYIEVCIVKDKLLKQNSSIEKELNDLKIEKNQLNDMMKCISSEKEELVHKLTLLQDELNEQKKEVENLKNKHEEEMRKTTEKHLREFDSFKLALKNEFSKVEIFHQDQLSKMELECAKKILEIENNHKTELMQIEANVKEEAMKICSEEIQMLSNSYKKQYDELISRNLNLEHLLKEKIANYEALKRQFDDMKSFQVNDEQGELKKLRAEMRNIETKYSAAISEWNEKLNQANEKHEKLRSDFQEVYNKYKKARKAATTLKETLDERNRFIKERHGQYVQTINEIHTHLNDVLNFKCAENNAMMADLLEGDELSPSKEFATVMCGINQKLLLLKNKTSNEIGIS